MIGPETHKCVPGVNPSAPIVAHQATRLLNSSLVVECIGTVSELPRTCTDAWADAWAVAWVLSSSYNPLCFSIIAYYTPRSNILYPILSVSGVTEPVASTDENDHYT